MLYVAYGSNINLTQMAFRCPHSRVVGTAMVKGWELEFRGVATIVPKPDTEVPVLLWELDPRDVPALNRYEGFPHLYASLVGDSAKCRKAVSIFSVKRFIVAITLVPVDLDEKYLLCITIAVKRQKIEEHLAEMVASVSVRIVI